MAVASYTDIGNNYITVRTAFSESSISGLNMTLQFGTTAVGVGSSYRSAQTLIMVYVNNVLKLQAGGYVPHSTWNFPNGSSSWTQTFSSGQKVNITQEIYTSVNGGAQTKYTSTYDITIPSLASKGSMTSVNNVNVGGTATVVSTAGSVYNSSGTTLTRYYNFSDGAGVGGSDSGWQTGASYPIPANWSSGNRQKKSVSATVSEEWRVGSTKIGATDSKNFTVTIPQTSPYALTSFDYSLNATKGTSGLDKPIKGYASVSVGANGSYNTGNGTHWAPSSCTGSIACGDHSVNLNGNATTFTPTKNGTYTASKTVTDDRGYSKTISKTVTIFDYTKPTASSFSLAKNGSGQLVPTFTLNGTSTIDGVANTRTAKLTVNGVEKTVVSGTAYNVSDWNLTSASAFTDITGTLKVYDLVNGSTACWSGSATATTSYTRPTITITNAGITRKTGANGNEELNFAFNLAGSILVHGQNNVLVAQATCNNRTAIIHNAASNGAITKTNIANNTFNLNPMKTYSVQVDLYDTKNGFTITNGVVTTGTKVATVVLTTAGAFVLMSRNKDIGVGIAKQHDTGLLDRYGQPFALQVGGSLHVQNDVTIAENLTVSGKVTISGLVKTVFQPRALDGTIFYGVPSFELIRVGQQVTATANFGGESNSWTALEQSWSNRIPYGFRPAEAPIQTNISYISSASRETQQTILQFDSSGGGKTVREARSTSGSTRCVMHSVSWTTIDEYP